MKILGLAATLFVVSLIAFFQAITLIPTDLGFTWMIGGFVTFAASAIVLAIGFATSTLIKAQRMGTMLSTIAGAATAERPRIMPDAPSMAQAGSSEGSTPSSQSLGKGALFGVGALAAGSAGLWATRTDPKAEAATNVPPKPMEPADSSDDRGQGEAIATIEALPPSLFDLPALPKLEKRDTAPETLPIASTRQAVLEDFERELFADFPAQRTDPPTEPLFSLKPFTEPGSETDPEAARIDELIVAEPEAPAPAAGPTLSAEPEPVEEKELPAAESGLIADADLAALDDAAPPLAPLETLEVVGAYDSGGTRFTMYSDGSVTAIGATMDLRFASLDALRAHIDGAQKA